MDKKAWIVCTLCVLGLFYLMRQQPRPPQQPNQPVPGAPGQPGTGTTAQPGTGTGPPAGTGNPVAPVVPPAEEVLHVLETPQVKFTLTNLGAGVKSAEVLDAPDHILLNANGIGPVGALNSESQPEYVNTDGFAVVEQSGKHVVYQGKTRTGLLVKKTYRLAEAEEGGGEKGGRDFLLELDVELTNPGDNRHLGKYFLYTGAASPVTTDEVDLYRSFFWNDSGDADYETVTYFGKGFFGGEAKIEFKQPMENLRWGGVMNQFYSTIVSAAGEGGPGEMWARRFPYQFQPVGIEDGDGTTAVTKFVVHGGVGMPQVDLEKGASVKRSYEIFMGPKEYRRLAKLGQERREVMFYGWFSVISRTLVNGLTWVRGWFPTEGWGWGWAVIIITIMLRILMWPLHAKSTRMSKKMGLLAPMMKDLKEKYKDNPQKMNQETMKMYREYGVNPIGGCLPLLFQIPIFFGFYRMLMYAAELRGEEWMWVKDLSAPDTVAVWGGIPINPLPIIMTVTMFLQMQMMPKTGDKMQRRIFMLMPFMFLWFCYSFASALPLYWSAQNIFGIGQTWLMRKMGGEAKLEKRELPKRAAPPTQPGQKPKKKKSSGPMTGGKAKSAGKKKRKGQ